MPFPATPCFWIEPSGLQLTYLRRYVYRESRECCGPDGYHHAMVFLDRREEVRGIDGVVEAQHHDLDDPRWPTQCEACDYRFTDEDPKQLFGRSLYRSDDGVVETLEVWQPGAMYDAEWLPWKGYDGRSLEVKLPNGRWWNIDGWATNCTKPEDRDHRCWVRHGEVPLLTVDKDGLTCAAGAGSIASGEGENHYHGFLQNGVLTAG